MSDKTNLEILCEIFGRQGGTIHQYCKMFDIDSSELISMNKTVIRTMAKTYKENSIRGMLEKLPNGENVVVCPSHIYAMITGTSHITINKDWTATLYYEDGTRESAKLVNIDWETGYLDIVTLVQSKRNTMGV